MKHDPLDPTLVESWLKEPVWLPESDTARIAQLVHQTPQQRGWRHRLDTERIQAMFSATKLVVGAIIVAAFGGFLLSSGVFSPEPVDHVPAMTVTPTESATESTLPSETTLPSPSLTTRPDPSAWGASVLPQAEATAALATGVAVGPDTLVAVGRRACERTKSEEIGRCWGQPWISTDGVTWEAVEARTSGLDLGRFSAVTSGPEVGVEGVAYGSGGYVAYGWARPDGRLTAMLWRSADGRTWERVPTPGGFDTEGLMLPGPWLMAIAGSEDGYLLGGTIYGKPAPRAAIWSSLDGLSWSLAAGDEVFDVGAYIDTMETPMTGGIEAIAIAPAGSGGAWHAIAVGTVCPEAKQGAGPKGAWSDAYDWTTGQCQAQAWRSGDGLAWERLDLPNGYSRAGSVATDGRQIIIGATSTEDHGEVISSANGIDWAANGGQAGRQVALAADSTGFRALVPRCLNEGCRRRSLDLWSSVDGVWWGLDQAQPTMPEGVQDFLDVNVADVGDRVVVTAGYWTAPRDGLASMALLSPPLAAPLSGPEPRATTSMAPDATPAAATVEAPATAEAMVVTLPPADAAPLPDTLATPAGRLAYVTGLDEGTARIRVLETDTGTDTLLTKGTEPSWSPDGTGIAYTCSLVADVTTASVCTTDVASQASERILRRAWGPQWSPDGSQLAFSRSRIDMGDAWVRDLASRSTLRLPGADPVWSPTGEWLMVTTGSGVPYVTVVRPDGTDEQVLGPGWYATWSPDGQRIASAWAGDEGTLVSAMDVATGETEPLFEVEGSILAMAWLPGDVMAIVDGGTDGGNLYAVDPADGTARSLTSVITFEPDSELAVSPDGRWLAFSATASDGTDICLASVEGGWRQLTERGDATMPAWAP
jgi:Tol biopolymer transport system component